MGKTAARRESLAAAFSDLEAARSEAARIKDEILSDLETHLEAFTAQCRRNGIQVYHAADAEEACAIAVRICRDVCTESRLVVKGKSMATEEIHLNEALEDAGFSPVETDLGEFVVQLDHDTPSHIVTPIIHKRRQEIAKSFAAAGLGPYTEEPTELTQQARRHLRSIFQQAQVGISGVNFGVVESGRLVIVENEGNNRLSTTAPQAHVAVMGIEKLLPAEQDLPLFLRLLAGSGTGQAITTYVHFISGPRRSDELDGPQQVHLILLDNGRRKVLAGPYRSILRCIRCGACLNVCPVYREASGHAYGHVYPGPLGAVLAPALEGVERLGELAKASTLCGACEEVCPVKIPIPDQLLQLRREAMDLGVLKDPVPWRWFGIGTKTAARWKMGLRLLPLAMSIPGPLLRWTEFREPPQREGRNFRSWWQDRGPRRSQFALTGQPSLVDQSSNKPEETPPEPTIDQLWLRFEARLKEQGGRVVRSDDLLSLKGLPTLADQDVPELGLGPACADPWDAELGITVADVAVADTGSLLLSTQVGRRRLASLAPRLHLVIVSRQRIVATLEEGLARLGPKTSVLVTGSSRTADIEGVLVRGVHGPQEVLVLILE
jgi:L-lactate dehydrogenase complex protein LldF